MNDPITVMVDSLTFEEHMEIIKDFEQFEKDGYIEDCLLRRTAQKLIRGPSQSIVLTMKDLVYGIYRHYAERYFSCMD